MAEFSVGVSAAAHGSDGQTGFAVYINQSVQAWTVIRTSADFHTLHASLVVYLPSLPPPPPPPSSPDVKVIVEAGLALNQYISQLLFFPGVRESPNLKRFLCDNANLIPAPYSSCSWSPLPPPPPLPPTVPPSDYPMEAGEMDMDDLFSDSTSPPPPRPATISSSLPVTEDERRELEGEADIMDGVGSFRMDYLEGSHLGRSLKAQGLSMEQQTEAPKNIPGLGDSFNSTTPISPPSLNSFKIIKVIGKGSFGKVFLVREKLTGEMFALKVLRKDNIIKRNQVEHTKTERNVLGYVKHPFIVGLNMAFQTKEKLYFVLDYCAGGELFFHLGKLGKFPEPRAQFYAAEITLAIDHVHSLDIIYRDLKPENVLLDAKGHVRLTDFGLSKEGISQSSSGANSFCGTPEYLAPEILNRLGHGRAVDWWSLGALLYEMLTGLPPFYCRDREKLFEKIRKADLNYPRYLSQRACHILRGLLTRDPQQRLGSGPGDAGDIKRHVFFENIDWKRMDAGEVPPPWDPKINGSLDTSQFDSDFTSMPIFSPGSLQQQSMMMGRSPAGSVVGSLKDGAFEGFTFTDRKWEGPQGGG
ncbi:hypothetical protein TrST_g9987 [Triparma strigata]|uniref:non-specific serine/threonine protein kinase n=1 Tax=Triparma strigata TaxID=1606541 RepID=A0A9W7BHP3_9STRA|nr:hypothetical protein TrST_g9987 [Triparma strigata]